MLTGQISSQARQDVQAHSSSVLMRSNIQLAGTSTVSSPLLRGGEVGGLPVRAMTSPVLSTISRGSRGFPVAWAGHTEVQRPHIVQASVSRSCFHEKSSTTEAPNVSRSVSPSTRLGMGRIAPLGTVAVAQVHVQRRCEHVAQHRRRQDHQEGHEGDYVGHPPRLVPAGHRARAVDEGGQRVADEAPALVVGQPVGRDPEGLRAEPGDADGQQHPRR